MKKLFLTVSYVLLILVLVEATGHLAFRITQGNWFSSSAYKKERQTIIEKYDRRDKRLAAELDKKPRDDGGWRQEIVHPYIGYVVDFHDKYCASIGFCDDRIRQYRKQFPDKIFVPKTEDNVIVALTGGSFAYGVGNTSSPNKWEAALSSIPAFKDKKIYLYTIALGGIKQPQQLNAISLFLSMGAEFDMVINVDGFNEIALPAAENVGRWVNPYFPRIWHRRVGRSKVDAKLSRLEGEHSFYLQQQFDFAERFQSRWYRNSALANYLWMVRNQKMIGKISDAEVATLEYGQEDKVLISTLEATGPKFRFTDYDDIVSQSVEFWSRSSRSLHGVARSHGVSYFHFLQPNQYLKGSKKMTEREREIAIVEDHPYAHAATQGYPMLVQEGKTLIDQEVNYTDLTKMFVDNDEVLYVDGCCHLNQAGYDYVVDQIINVVAAHYSVE